MGEAVFEVREVIISLCAKPGCPEWARWEIRLLGKSEGWRVCSRHKRWAKRISVGDDQSPPIRRAGDGRGEGGE